MSSLSHHIGVQLLDYLFQLDDLLSDLGVNILLDYQVGKLLVELPVLLVLVVGEVFCLFGLISLLVYCFL